MFSPEPLPTLPLTFAQALARMEGWYAQGSVPNRPQRNNNPGDLDFEPWQSGFGAVLEGGVPEPRFAAFPTAEQGWAALNALLAGPSYASLTIEQAINRFAPSAENNTDGYIAAVCHWTGKQPGELQLA
jgi:hypothetical protein